MKSDEGTSGREDLREALRERALKHSAWYRQLGSDTDADVELLARQGDGHDGDVAGDLPAGVSSLARYFDGMSGARAVRLLAPPPPPRSPSQGSDEGCPASSDDETPRRAPALCLRDRDDSAVELDDGELPSSPTTRRGRVRSSLLLEAQCVAVPLPLDYHGTDRKLSLDETGLHRTRFVRTPSVIVSDYSEDCPSTITPEEVDYFRRHLRPVDSGSECSLDSSCSNLNSCCGSQISILDGDLALQTPDRKISDCSSCSTLSGNEDDEPDSGLGRTCPRVNKIAVRQ